MKYLRLYKNNSQILGSTGIMKVDGRLNIISIISQINDKNLRLKNFSHEICNGFYFTDNCWNEKGNLIKL